MFALLQVPFAVLVRQHGGRYSFVNNNFCFRRCFDLLGVSHYGVDFPPLKSKKKRDDIVAMWLKMIQFLRWPYVNSDARLFGDKYATATNATASPQRKPQQRRRIPAAHTNASSAATGRLDTTSACAPHRTPTADEWLAQLCVACDDLARDADYWRGALVS